MLCKAKLLYLNSLLKYILQKHIYGHQGKNVQIFADNSNLAVNPSYIRSWLDVLSRTPRVAPFLSKDDPFIMALKKVLLDVRSLYFVNFYHIFNIWFKSRVKSSRMDMAVGRPVMGMFATTSECI